MNDKIVTTDPLIFLQALKQTARQRFVRFPVFLFGDDAFVTQTLTALNELEQVTVVSDHLPLDHRVTWSHARQLLGQETGTLALDIRHGVDVDKLCAAAGCIKGGELLLLVVGNAKPEALFDARLRQFANHPAAASVYPDGRCLSPAMDVASVTPDAFSRSGRTASQQTAVDAIHKVLSGHRRRPALLVADRGRGKSSAMGMAAAEILVASSKQILVTAPSVANVATLMSHAASLDGCERHGKFEVVTTSGGSLRFVAPDALLRDKPACDLLLVDEAAAIPLPMLSTMLNDFSRIAFSSTEHGYEGTGRAFSTRFRALLDTEAKGWKEISLTTPVRWADNDPLERWLFDAFLFDAEPTLPTDLTSKATYRILSQDELARDEALLGQVFALLVTAHYQTSPNDLLQLLNGDDQTLIGAFCDKVLVGALLAAKEGGFDAELAEAVTLGKRRLRGHLLPQSLASHTGVSEVLHSPMLRVVRLAVLPECRHRGIGKTLVSEMEAHASKSGITVVGTSFGATTPLWQFWSSMGYQALRLGVLRDAASGTYSLQLVKCLSAPPSWFEELQALFTLNFSQQLTESFSEMETGLALMLLSHQIETDAPPMFVNTQAERFAHGALGFDLIVGSLRQWFLHWLATTERDTGFDTRCIMLAARLLQQHAWHDIAAQFGYRGRKDAEAAMRQWILEQLTK